MSSELELGSVCNKWMDEKKEFSSENLDSEGEKMKEKIEEKLRVYREPKVEEPDASPLHGASSNNGRFHII